MDRNKDTDKDNQYSRQYYAIGKDTTEKLNKASVLISGSISSCDLELAKCVILTGAKKVSLHSPNDELTYIDLSSNYYYLN
jgi:hypothetical protein